MKKLFIFATIALFTFAFVTENIHAQKRNGRGCQARTHQFVDANGDGVCDNFVDANGDGVCDNCIKRGGRGRGR